MERDAERGVDWVHLPVIATVARLLCRELTLQNEYLLLEYPRTSPSFLPFLLQCPQHRALPDSAYRQFREHLAQVPLSGADDAPPQELPDAIAFSSNRGNGHKTRYRLAALSNEHLLASLYVPDVLAQPGFQFRDLRPLHLVPPDPVTLGDYDHYDQTCRAARRRNHQQALGQR